MLIKTAPSEQLSVCKGTVRTVTLENQTFTYAIKSEDTLSDVDTIERVAKGLAKAIDDSPDYEASTSGRDTIVIGRWQQRSFKPSTTITAGATRSITLDGKSFSYTIQAGDTLQNVLEGLAAAINTDAEFSAVAAETDSAIEGNETIQIVRSATRRSYEATGSGANVSIANWVSKTFTVTGEIASGDEWIALIDSTAFSYTVGDDDALNSIAAGLAEKINASDEFFATATGISLSSSGRMRDRPSQSSRAARLKCPQPTRCRSLVEETMEMPTWWRSMAGRQRATRL